MSAACPLLQVRTCLHLVEAADRALEGELHSMSSVCHWQCSCTLWDAHIGGLMLLPDWHCTSAHIATFGAAGHSFAACSMHCEASHLLFQTAKPRLQELRLLGPATHRRHTSHRHDVPPEAPACNAQQDTVTCFTWSVPCRIVLHGVHSA